MQNEVRQRGESQAECMVAEHGYMVEQNENLYLCSEQYIGPPVYKWYMLYIEQENLYIYGESPPFPPSPIVERQVGYGRVPVSPGRGRDERRGC